MLLHTQRGYTIDLASRNMYIELFLKDWGSVCSGAFSFYPSPFEIGACLAGMDGWG